MTYFSLIRRVVRCGTLVISWKQVFVLTAANPQTDGCTPKVCTTLPSASHAPCIANI